MTTLDDRFVVARVHHSCEVCTCAIVPREKYRRQKIAWDGSVYTFKVCVNCFDLYEVVERWSLSMEGIGQDTYTEWANDVVRGYEPVEPVVYSQAIEFLARLRGGDR